MLLIKFKLHLTVITFIYIITSMYNILIHLVQRETFTFNV